MMNACRNCGAPAKRDFCSRRCSATHRHRSVDVATRFWSKVDKSGPITSADLGPCWTWTAGKDRDGYGVFTLVGKYTRANRIAWKLTHGTEPPCVCHRCDNPSCVNPAHLFEGTNADNTRDAVSKGRMASGDRNGMRTHPESRPRGPMPPRDPAKVMRGVAHPNAKLSDETVRYIRAQLKSGRTQRRIAEELGISYAIVTLVKQRKLWAHVS